MPKHANHFLDQVDRALQPVLQAAIERFQLDPISIHGPAHWLKVLHNAALLANQTKGADLLVCQLFSLLHDCAREDDGSDLEHGPRAATHVLQLYLSGRLAISQNQLDVLRHACEHHAHGEISGDPTTGVCWDADRLDLPRVGARVDARYLSTQAAKTMIHKPTG